MTFTYDSTDISTDLARVRDRIGDVFENDALLTDEEINALLATYTGWREAAMHAIKRIMGRIAREVSRSATGLSSQRAQQFVHFQDLLNEVKDELYAAAAPILVGPSSIADKENVTGNSDKVQPIATRDTFTNSQG